jgi:hypothetical protein
VRKDPSSAQKKRLLQKNANVCCVCKQRGLGLHFHHIDGDNSNTVDENLAVLCVQDHDVHHRPQSYSSPKHLELGAERIKELKESWEAFVEEAKKPNPKVLAVLTTYGDYSNIHSMRLVFQWQDDRIEFTRTYHLLDGPMDELVDNMLEEIRWLGDNISLVLIDEPQPVEYCPCCHSGYSRTLDKNMAIKLTADSWEDDSLCSIYVNPTFPSLAINIFFRGEVIYRGHLHLCGDHLHYHCDKFDERVPIRGGISVREQAIRIIVKIFKDWGPGGVLIGTGDHDDPYLIDDLILPEIWEVGSHT